LFVVVGKWLYKSPAYKIAKVQNKIGRDDAINIANADSYTVR